MSVIWSGITEGGAIVPVQVDESGKVVATADPRPELWTKTGEILTPTTPTDDIQTSGNLVLNGAFGSSTLTSADSSGVKVYALPEESGTLALVGDTPEPSGDNDFFAYGTFKSDQIIDSKGIRSFFYVDSGDLYLYYENNLVNDIPLITATVQNPSLISYYTVTPITISVATLQIRVVNSLGNAVTPIPPFSFSIIDMDALNPKKTVSLSRLSDFGKDPDFNIGPT